MLDILKYLRCRYVDGGRTDTEMDCWQMVRTARHEAGFPLLPAYGALRNTNPRAFTKAYESEAALMEPCAPEHGAIAAVLHGKVCVHVALVLENAGELWVLEINPVRGPRFMRHNTWVRDHLTVTYHRDAHDQGLS